LRSFDLSMPEEINRMVTDCLSDYFFVTEESGIKNLLNEGKPIERIHFVGNVMIDDLFHQLKRLQSHNGVRFPSEEIKKKYPQYIFLTLHRPSNVDSRKCFMEIADTLNLIAEDYPIFFPVHPRTSKMMQEFAIKLSPRVKQLPPLGFKESLFLWKDAVLVMTDSGGLQEETTALGVPCITLRENTERPITIEMGTNILAGTSKDSILKAYTKALQRGRGKAKVPPKWDGRAAERIWEVLL
ncbi:MAG TPA: UDP-N-acetyl glucosamine 2-epimerase, partial [Desulfobacterales bacterium]|nr:UDP-N-acetyl glucosamine 2-epimerase [Desulfobacterales bacterium]